MTVRGLRHVEARGLVFERPRPHEAKGRRLTPLTRLFDIEDLSLTDARLRVACPRRSRCRRVVCWIPGRGHSPLQRHRGLTFGRRTHHPQGNYSPAELSRPARDRADLEWRRPRTSAVARRRRFRPDQGRVTTTVSMRCVTLTCRRGECAGPKPSRNLADPPERNASATLGERTSPGGAGFDLGGLLLASGRLGVHPGRHVRNPGREIPRSNG